MKTIKTLFHISLSLLCFLTFTNCEDKDKEDIMVKSIKFTNVQNGEIKVLTGKSTKVEVEVLPENATTKTIVFDTSDSGILTIDKDGNIKGVATGEATLTVSTEDGSLQKITCKVKVENEVFPVSSITVVEAIGGKIAVPISTSVKISVAIAPENATNKAVEYVSLTTNIFTIDQDGNIQGLTEGTGKLEVRAKDGSGVKATYDVVVESILPTSFVVPTTETLKILSTLNLASKITFLPANVTEKVVTYSSDNLTVATVDVNGLVTPKGAGVANISVTVKMAGGGNQTKTCAVTVDATITYVKLERADFDAEASATSGDTNFETLFDDNFGSFWGTPWAEPRPPLPHYITVNLRQLMLLGKVFVALPNSNEEGTGAYYKSTKTLVLEVSTDGTNYTEIESFLFGADVSSYTTGAHTYLFTPRMVKYVRLKFPDTNHPNNSLVNLGTLRIFKAE